MLVLWSARPQRYSLDVDHEYRQESNLYYLTGLTQDSTILVLMPGNRRRREILFVKDRNDLQEHVWGTRLTREQAAARTGIATVLLASQFEAFIAGMFACRGFGVISAAEARRFSLAVEKGRATLALLADARSMADPPSLSAQFAKRLQRQFGGFQVANATPILSGLRTIKTSYERRMLAVSLAIACEAQIQGMRAAKAGAFERDVKAAVEAVHRSRGAVSWSCPTIVASGPNATTLHYGGGERQMNDGELLLVDAACNFRYLTGDVTRTYPVGGVFSPRQRDLYQIVLDALTYAEARIKRGSTLNSIHQDTVAVIARGLARLGLVADPNSDQYKLWYAHKAAHYIGVDMHDVGDPSAPLVPGMAFAIEPGLYIRQAALDALPRNRENDRVIAALRRAVRKYLDIGIRIEDAYILDRRLNRLSATLPRGIVELQATLKRFRTAT